MNRSTILILVFSLFAAVASSQDDEAKRHIAAARESIEKVGGSLRWKGSNDNWQIWVISFSKTKVTDSELVELIPIIGNLTGDISINIGRADVTDVGLKKVSELRELRYLILDGNTKFTSVGLKIFAQHKSLTELSLDETRLTDDDLTVQRRISSHI